ncbi:MAG: hypothetical protein JWQ55_2372 [Rhodopila sp.]|jgi:hypothetical protein|nr:hypothetical protein [Rhodopila sp.]
MVDTVNLEFLMRRRAPIFPPALLVSILGGCAWLDAAPPLAAAQSQNGLYECRLISQGVATPGPDVRLMLRPVSQNGQLPLKIEPDDWQSLDAAVGSNGRIFANPIYAWRFDQSGGVLTDIRNIETYHCIVTAGSPDQAR